MASIGLVVAPAELSVMPQASVIGRPSASMNSWVSRDNGAAPEAGSRTWSSPILARIGASTRRSASACSASRSARFLTGRLGPNLAQAHADRPGGRIPLGLVGLGGQG